MTKEERAIQYLKSFEPVSEPYHLCYSGGKDSDCIRILADLAGVNYEIHNSHTTVDAPETVYYIRSVMEKYGEPWVDHDPIDGHKRYRYGDKAFIDMPLQSMWQLIEKKTMPPTRFARYCCSELKEKGGKGRVKITGVRWAESVNRKNNSGLVTIKNPRKKAIQSMEKSNANFRLTNKGVVVLNTDNDESRRVVECCYRTMSTLVNPIIDWTDQEVWEFLRYYGCESNPLYKEGFARIGCVGCPLSSSKNMYREFARYPKYKEAYIRAFDKMILNRKKPFDIAKSGKDVMKWWLGEDINQITIEDYLKDIETL